ncbi:MAG: glycosyltransferase family 4 protein [Chloroflexota bacterium]
MSQTTLAIVSTDIRRDLIAPMRSFTRLRLTHFYRQAGYNDLTPADLDDSLVPYDSPAALHHLLAETRPDLLQNVEIFSLRQFPYVRVITGHASRYAIPLYAGVHISLPLRYKYGLPIALALKLILQPTLRATRLFFYLNEGGRRNLRWLGVPEAKMKRLMYATWGVDPDEFTPIRDGREPAWDAPTVLFIGRIDAEKGVFDLLEAWQQVQTTVPGTQLKLVGSGPQQADAQAWVQQHGLADSIQFLGTIKNRDLPPLLRAAAVFTCPSQSNRKWEEYVGMTNIQAMACCVPVVTTRSGAIPEYVPEAAGILAPERDPAALAEGLIRLLKNPALRRQMGQAGRAHAVTYGNAFENVRRAEEILLQTLHENRP